MAFVDATRVSFLLTLYLWKYDVLATVKTSFTQVNDMHNEVPEVTYHFGTVFAPVGAPEGTIKSVRIMLATLRDGNGFPGLELEENDGSVYDLNKGISHVWACASSRDQHQPPGR